MASSSLANLRGTGTGQVSRNHRSSTGCGRSHVAPPLRLKSDQVLTKCQNVVPSPTAWLSDAATKTASSSSVTCAASSGARRGSPSTEAASALTSPLSGNRDATSSHVRSIIYSLSYLSASPFFPPLRRQRISDVAADRAAAAGARRCICELPHSIYALPFSPTAPVLACDSFLEDLHSRVSLLSFDPIRPSAASFRALPALSFDHPYPPAKLQFNPRAATPSLPASSADMLRIWHAPLEDLSASAPPLELRPVLDNRKASSEFSAPLTGPSGRRRWPSAGPSKRR
ncbi:protein TRANSPARENT TESTA GLABRA 1 [Panicum miliaceum]|uniref:Protein TRANSPARENT TESTA GLABRA 1 n=1 Tax=Panicum miliaceum TaxID=4540 RepID=A0A3L6TKH3_PANMI|nr:protein TRANSPARENT TESTA GLABRA 1 [Panicum miliaceum]